jgi:hypothetical protein
MSKHDIRVDLAGVDLAGLVTEDDFRRAARRLLPAALEELGRALGEAAWARRHPLAPAPASKGCGPGADRREFVARAGHTYRLFASAAERRALEDLLVAKLREAKAAAGTQDGGGTVVGP